MEELLFPLIEISSQRTLHVNISHHPPYIIAGNISALIKTEKEN